MNTENTDLLEQLDNMCTRISSQNNTASIEDINLVLESYKAMINSYSPYSKFKVGAAVLGSNNKIYKGCNIENASFGATNCAERTAIFSCIADGNRSIKKIAIASSAFDITMPCGICRQVMQEFANKDFTVLLTDSDGIIKTYTLMELLPYSFTSDEMN